MRKMSWLAVVASISCITLFAQAAKSSEFKPVPELGYRVLPDFFQFPSDTIPGESSAVALNSKGHIFLFRRAKPMLCEFDEHGKFIRSLAEGAFDHPHGLRIDKDDNIWTTDDGSHLVLKLSPSGQVLLVLGRKDWGAEADWLFGRPTDIAFGHNGEIYVSDGYSNSRVIEFNRDGDFIRAWGTYGTGSGQFIISHSVVVDDQGLVYVADRENKRIQIFDAEGKFLKEWTGIGYPYGLFLAPDHHIWMADGGYNRIVELDQNGKILGALGSPGHRPGQFGWAHYLAIGPDGKLYVADTLNWRFQVFEPVPASGKMAEYVPTARSFFDSKPSTGWFPRQTDLPKK
jgi:DNA-binding beta-propeller fold protein YncE